MQESYILVGDKFATFANQENVTTPLVFAAALENGHIGRCHVIRGQGVSDAWMAHIAELSERSDVAVSLSCDVIRSQRASSRSCHKVKRQNILISEPRRIKNDTFGAQLLVDEDCELMGDHQSGHHLQGMLLVEAARQMFLAVIERFLRPGHANYAVINHLNSSFHTFAFPLAVDIELKVVERQETRPDRGRFEVEVNFLQNGSSVTTVETCFTVFDAETLGPKEASMAQSRTQDFIATAKSLSALAS